MSIITSLNFTDKLYSYLNDNKNKLPYYFASLIFVVFAAVNWGFIGPHYMSDEITYLSKAAAIAGHAVDLPTVPYPGYSLLLAPLFFIFSDPFYVWKGVIVINALMWAASFFLLFHVLRYFFPDSSQKKIYAVLAICAFYPAWITMSGYAFATTAFTFFFMLILFALVKCMNHTHDLKWAIISALATGFITWIHPIGLGVIISYCMILCLGRTRICRTFLLPIIIAVSMLIILKLLIAPLLYSLTSVSGEFPISNYPGIRETLHKLANLPSLLNYIPHFFAPYLYLVVSSFGIVNYFAFYSFKRVNEAWNLRESIKAHDFLLVFLCLALGFAFIATISLNITQLTTFSPMKILGLSYLFHGRYPEMLFLPILGIALMNFSVDRKLLLSFIILILLSYVLLTPWLEIPPGMNWINAQGFWPTIFWTTQNSASIFVWLTISIAVIGILYAMIPCVGKKVIIIILFINIGSISHMYHVHTQAFTSYAVTSDLISFIRANYSPDSKIAFDFQSIPHSTDRYNLYTFWLFNYKFAATSVDKWQSSDAELFITKFPENIDQKNNAIIALDRTYNLYLFRKGKESFDNFMYPPESDNPNAHVIYAESPFDPRFASIPLGSMLKLNVSILPSFAGNKDGSSLVTTNKSGALIFGPYEPIEAGDYEFTLFGKINNASNAWMDVFSSEAGNVQFVKHNLAGNSEFDNDPMLPDLDVIQKFNFTIPNDISDFQFRIFVDEKADMRIDAYIVRKITRDE